ncbi:DNA-binding LytR/AlgR family response regulator [Cellulosimicrobium cellulans]|uniref:LytR/AlgR family response regulator transcription factor n=1 Tax=Cellulosimicrobium cellulans TaxID=1710 RepID=UPI0027DB4225|nr:LytTR family DNA-binding domain-containing protein [Cellulosimicrobium cellulans]MBM7817687.1 DNA-binding LytR/AlgR family response regulator [Cellulosimicrobium cellulans]
MTGTDPTPGPASEDPAAVGLDVLVADDERPVLDELVALLRRDPRVRTVLGVATGSEALRELSSRTVDAAFLDIHMPGLTGLDLARALSRFADRPAVVFVTADEARALEAFDVEAVDYVLKPVRRERLTRAVDRVVERVADRAGRGAGPGVGGGVGAWGVPDGGGSPSASAAAPPAAPGREAPEHETLVVTVGTTTRLVRRSAVRWVQAQGDYSRLVTDTEQFLVREPLSDLEERWAPAGFLRVHRSYLVDRAAVTAARFGGAQPALVVAGHEVPVSRRMVPAVREALLGPHRGPS